LVAGAEGSGQLLDDAGHLAIGHAKKLIALSFRTPSVTVTSDTASTSPPTRRLIVKRQGPFAGYSMIHTREALGSADALFGLWPLKHKLVRQDSSHGVEVVRSHEPPELASNILLRSVGALVMDG
jgi:hypothetical protein